MKTIIDSDRLGTSPAPESDPKREMNEVPPVTADIDETPRIIRYGAAVLLGLVLGTACYIWINGRGDSAMKSPEPQRSAYNSTTSATSGYTAPVFDGADEVDEILGTAASAESVAPTTTYDINEADPEIVLSE